MLTVTWNFPTRILFGDSALDSLDEEARKLKGTRALVVTDPGVASAGLASRVQEALRTGGIPSTMFDAVSSNPTEAQVLAAAEAFKAANADLIVGIGGGSAIDVAKLVRICANHSGPLSQYDDAKGGSAKIIHPLPPMIAIPTTAGTGSEVGRSAVATIEATNRKTVFFAPNLVPNVALLDPMLTVSMPSKLTACTGFDALTHCIEALCTKMDHPMGDAIAMEGIRLVHGHLERAVQEPSDLQARGAMLKAAMMGAVAFQKGLGACHSLAHPLSTETGMHHGLANALCLPAVVDFNRATVPAKLAIVARLLGMRIEDEETLAFECSGTIRALRSKVGLPEGLGASGVQASMLEHLADLAFEDGCHLENPRPCSREDLLSLYKASM